ncbi:hypothetical protein EOL70_13590 [Leucothrix sargassi]|nr:hypothetical protein EOL70_13590 [Leucothrix sargassi]
MKLLITLSKKAPFLTIQSADSAEVQIKALQAELRDAAEKANSTAAWLNEEMSFIQSEINESSTKMNIAFGKINAAQKKLEANNV